MFTPNPLAAGIPTSGDPILLDISASYTTNGLTGRLHTQGESCRIDGCRMRRGTPTRDPAVLFNEPKGTLLPLGGLEAGHKGYALALLVEALTGGLAGIGRADPNEGWGATVFVQVLDPAAFGGVEDFVRQTDWLADACRTATPRPGGDRACACPASAACKRMREQQEQRRRAASTDHAGARAVGRKLGVAVPKEVRWKALLAPALLMAANVAHAADWIMECPAQLSTSQMPAGELPAGWSGIARTASSVHEVKPGTSTTGVNTSGRHQRIRWPAIGNGGPRAGQSQCAHRAVDVQEAAHARHLHRLQLRGHAHRARAESAGGGGKLLAVGDVAGRDLPLKCVSPAAFRSCLER